MDKLSADPKACKQLRALLYAYNIGGVFVRRFVVFEPVSCKNAVRKVHERKLHISYDKLYTKLLKLPDQAYYLANVAIGWASPLNHATYHMHNFGYDLLPRMWQSFAIFGLLIGLGWLASLRAIKNYNFNFTGTEG